MKQVKNIFFIACLFLMTSITAGHAQVTIGSLTNPEGGALLDLKERDFTLSDTTSSNRGLVFPRVKLTNLTELYPMYYRNGEETTEYTSNRNPLKRKHMGLTVYNLTKDTNFNPGLYTWNGQRWVKPVTELPSPVQTSINLLDLKATPGSTDVKVKKITNTADITSGGSLLLFGDNGYISIPENGTYFFYLRLYGEHIIYPSLYYISLWVGGSVNDNGENATLTDATLKESLETFISANPYNGNQCLANCSVTMCCYLNAGDQVRFKIGCDPSPLGSGYANVVPWTLKCSPNMTAERSTMLWWKL